MLLGEPPPTQADLNFRLLGIPVRVHPFFWVVAVLLGLSAGDFRGLVIWIAALFVAILVHEFGHATAMRYYGLQPWITLYGMGGLASYNQSQGYGSRRLDSAGQVIISAAGPGAGFLLGATIIAGVVAAGYRVEFSLGGQFGFWIRMEQVGPLELATFIRYVLFISIIWGMVNLLPVYPLDGGQIARELLLRMNPQEGIRQSLILSIFTASGLAILAFVKWNDWFVTFLFGYLAYTSYATLLAYSGRGRHW